jgi:hypothetical protein
VQDDADEHGEHGVDEHDDRDEAVKFARRYSGCAAKMAAEPATVPTTRVRPAGRRGERREPGVKRKDQPRRHERLHADDLGEQGGHQQQRANSERPALRT